MGDHRRLPLEDEVHARLVRVEHVLQLRVLGKPLHKRCGFEIKSVEFKV